jgi:hypothetical protein
MGGMYPCEPVYQMEAMMKLLLIAVFNICCASAIYSGLLATALGISKGISKLVGV